MRGQRTILLLDGPAAGQWIVVPAGLRRYTVAVQEPASDGSGIFRIPPVVELRQVHYEPATRIMDRMGVWQVA